MEARRKEEIGGHVVEEFYWHGDYPVYIDNRKTDETFKEACQRLTSNMLREYSHDRQ